MSFIQVIIDLVNYLNMTKKMAPQKKTIGQGGQAKIRKYYSKKFKRTVVEKVLNIDNDDLGYESVLDEINLYKEAILLSGLNHPNIVKIYDLKTDPPTIIMEYCEHGMSKKNFRYKSLKSTL